MDPEISKLENSVMWGKTNFKLKISNSNFLFEKRSKNLMDIESSQILKVS